MLTAKLPMESRKYVLITILETSRVGRYHYKNKLLITAKPFLHQTQFYSRLYFGFPERNKIIVIDNADKHFVNNFLARIVNVAKPNS